MGSSNFSSRTKITPWQALRTSSDSKPDRMQDHCSARPARSAPVVNRGSTVEQPYDRVLLGIVCFPGERETRIVVVQDSVGPRIGSWCIRVTGRLRAATDRTNPVMAG